MSIECYKPTWLCSNYRQYSQTFFISSTNNAEN